MTRTGPVFHVVTLVALAILLALGTWQLQRLAWKEGLIAAIERQAGQPPVPLETVLADPARLGGEDILFTPVTVDAAASGATALVAGIVDGGGVWRVLRARTLADGRAVWVEEDHVPYGGGAAVTLPQPTAPRPGPLTGALRLAEAAPAVAAGSASRTSFATVDPVQFPAIAGARLVPEVWVAAHQVRRPDGSLVANPFAAPDLPNRHFEYAITWYGLAGALLAVYVARLVRRPRGAAAPRAANQPPDSPRQA